MNFAIPLSAHTFVNAAVNVVFPWSTCPIVPTFTCGFVRSYFCLAISQAPVGGVRSDYELRSGRLLAHRRHATRARTASATALLEAGPPSGRRSPRIRDVTR